MMGTLSQHSIRLLYICVKWYYDPASPILDFHVDPTDEDGIIAEPHTHVRPKNPLKTLDIAALAGHAMRSIPSLQYFVLSTSWAFLGAHVWEVQRDAQGQFGGARLVQLSQGDGDRVLKEAILHSHR